MPIPALSQAQVSGLTEQVTSYINQQRQTYSRIALPLATDQKLMMRRFFSQGTLDRARVALLHEHIPNPPFYPALVSMGFSQTLLPDFSAMAATTFVDVLVFQAAYDT
jgi:hypothetical protein